MDSRFSRNNEVTHNHPQRNQQPAGGVFRHGLPQEISNRHEAHVCAGEEKDQPDKGVPDAHADLNEGPAGQPQGDKLKDQEKQDDGQQAEEHLGQVFRKAVQKFPPGVLGSFDHRDLEGGVGHFGGIIEQPQDHNSQDRPYAANGHNAEIVVVLAFDAGKARPQGHDEGDGDGAGGDAAGIEGHRQKFIGDKDGKQEHQAVQHDQGVLEGKPQPRPQHGQDQEDPHPGGHSQDDGQVRHRRNLPGQHLQIRLRDGHREANEEKDEHSRRDFRGTAQLAAHLLPHGHHGHVRAQGEEPHAQNQQGGSQQEKHQGADGHRSQGEGQQQDDDGDGEDRRNGLQNFFFEFFLQWIHLSIISENQGFGKHLLFKYNIKKRKPRNIFLRGCF